MQVYQGERQTLCHLQPLLLRQEPSDSRLKWHVPIGPVQRQSQSSDIEFLPSSLVQSAMQQAFAATEATSDQQSDDSAAKCTSSTGYSHSPPLSPRGKRPCSVRAVAAVRNMPSRRSVSHLAATDARGGGGPDSPEGLDTPENHRDFAARGRGEETVRERAASGLYGLRRLKASPRWDPEAAQLSDDSRSAGMKTVSSREACQGNMASCLHTCNKRPCMTKHAVRTQSMQHEIADAVLPKNCHCVQA